MMDESKFQKDLRSLIQMEENAKTILGVSQFATTKEIKKAYRELVKRFHPDLNPEQLQIFIRIQKAYEFLIEGKPDAILLDNFPEQKRDFKDNHYRLDNSWGYFLWWKDRWSF